jgi:hypothetical protein
MIHLRKFNEGFEIDPKKSNQIERAFQKAKVTPVSDKIDISRIYDLLIIQSTNLFKHEDWEEECKYIAIDLIDSSMGLYPTLDDLVQGVNEDEYIVCEDWEEFKELPDFVNVLEYNDINFQQIENILLDFDIRVENIWALLK